MGFSSSIFSLDFYELFKMSIEGRRGVLGKLLGIYCNRG